MQLATTRYSTRPFPAYRYVPGQAPHPTAHPEGHSYVPPGAPPHRVEPCLPDAWQCSEEYLYGVDLYNHAYWWEAHEAWEGLWQLTDKGAVQGRFLQGLIQASAAHLKLWTSHSEGVKRLWPSSLGYLRFALEHAGMEPYMGVALAEFVTDLDAYFRRLLSVAPIMRCDAERFPYITLQGIKPGVSACPW